MAPLPPPGVPTNVTPDILCDSVSELVRMSTAALLALFVYLNFKREGTDLPSDEAVLVFSTIGARWSAGGGSHHMLLAPAVRGCALQRSAFKQRNRPPQPQHPSLTPPAPRPPRPQKPHPPAAVNSTSNPANAEAIDDQMAQLEAPGAIRCAHIRWLMHFVRQLVMNHMGGVCHVLGNKQRHAECMVAAQHDHRLMVKALPEVAMGYR